MFLLCKPPTHPAQADNALEAEVAALLEAAGAANAEALEEAEEKLALKVRGGEGQDAGAEAVACVFVCFGCRLA